MHFNFKFSEMALQTISESVYVGLCLKLGTPQQIAIRRDIVEINQVLEHKITRTDEFVKMQSGSRREGFRLKDSDIDIMIWSNDHRVYWDFSQIQLFNTQSQVLILCVSSESPPGFTLIGYHWRQVKLYYHLWNSRLFLCKHI